VNPHRHNAALQTLTLGHNQIGAVGASAIGEGLRCVVIHSVWLGLLLCVSEICSGVGVVEVSI
jgi:hypothetical protein